MRLLHSRPGLSQASVKEYVFSLLQEESNLTVTDLRRRMKDSYGISVTFQAVLKATNILSSEGILRRENKHYCINPEWVMESRRFFDTLSQQLHGKVPVRKKMLGKNVTVYTVSNLFELDRLWNELLEQWALQERHDLRNVWKGKHCWWLIPRLQEEDRLHDVFRKQKVRTYNLLSCSTPLDRIAVNYYKKKKEHVDIVRDVSVVSDVSAFGDHLMKFEIPPFLAKRLEMIYSRTKHLGQLDLQKVLDIFKTEHAIEVMVLTDAYLANKMKDEVISFFKR